MKVTQFAGGFFSLLIATLMSAEPALRVVTIAGVPGESGQRDGDAVTALFSRPTWIEQAGTGRLYVVDRNNDAVRVIAAEGVSTLVVYRDLQMQQRITFDFGGPLGGGIAVEPLSAGCGSGPWARAILVSSTAQHQISMIADPWSGVAGFTASRDDIPTRVGILGQPGFHDGYGTAFYHNPSALLTEPGDVALSANYTGRSSDDAVYIADTGNHTIRRVRLAQSFEGCWGLSRVDTLAGGAREPGYADGAGASARFNFPRGIASAPDGSVYVADSGNHVIRRITPDGIVTTVAGQPGVAGHRDGAALDALLNLPSGIAVNDAGEVFIADTSNHCIRKLTPEGMLVTIAGTPGVSGHADGMAGNARFAGPVGLALTPRGVVVADTSNDAIRRIEVQPSRRRAVHATR